MSRRHLAGLLIPFGCLTAAACSEQSPVAPGATIQATQVASGNPQAVDGCYDLSFLDNSLQPVTTLVVLNELVLKAHVDDCSGGPAAKGAVTFQYCSLKGLPPNDITRADEAPLSACASGDANW